MSAVSDNKKLIGEIIRKNRKEKKLTQDMVHVSTGLSRNYISDIENGRYTPSINALLKLAKCLDIDLNMLLSGTEIPVDTKIG